MRQDEIERAKQFWEHADGDTIRNSSWSAIPYFEEQIARRLTKKSERGSRHPLAEASRVAGLGDADEPRPGLAAGASDRLFARVWGYGWTQLL